MKKQLNTDTVANELRDASAFFRPRPAPPPAVPEQRQELIRSAAGEGQQAARTGSTSRPPRAGAPPRRRMKRHPFEIYEDQYDSLVRLAAEERMAGGAGSMSRMVRDALDRLIAERRGEGE